MLSFYRNTYAKKSKFPRSLDLSQNLSLWGLSRALLYCPSSHVLPSSFPFPNALYAVFNSVITFPSAVALMNVEIERKLKGSQRRTMTNDRLEGRGGGKEGRKEASVSLEDVRHLSCSVLTMLYP